jgi:hypothetical protein
LLEFLQLALLASVGVFSVISSPRFFIHQVFEGLNVPLDFQAVTLAYADLLAILVVITTALRAFAEDDYRRRLSDALRALLNMRYAAFFAVFLVWMSAGILWAKQPSLLIATTLHFAACLLLSAIVADFVRARGTGILWAIVIGGAVQAMIGIAQVLRNDTLGLSAFGEVPRLYYEPDNFFRASGLSMHANYLGGYLMLALFAILCLAWTAHQRVVWRALLAALGMLIAAGLLGTLSRSAMLSTAISCLPLAWLVWRRLGIRAVFLTTLGISAALVFTFFAVRGDFATRFLSGREFFFEDSWTVIQNAPVIGVGSGNLMYAVSLNVGETLAPKLPVHNVYLYIWAETGIIGLAIFTAALALNLSRLRARRGMMHLIIGCGVLALVAVSLFDNYTWAVHPHRVITFLWLGIWWGTTWRTEDESSSRGALLT